MTRSRNEFKEQLDAELEHVVFRKKDDVIKRISARPGRLKNLLDKEITVHVGLFACVVLLCVTMLATRCYNIMHISESEIEKSKISVESLNGGTEQ